MYIRTFLTDWCAKCDRAYMRITENLRKLANKTPRFVTGSLEVLSPVCAYFLSATVVKANKKRILSKSQNNCFGDKAYFVF